MSSKKHPTDNILWEDIQSLISEDKNRDFLGTIDPNTFLLVLDESSRPQVLDTVLNMLREKEPENATKEYAEKIVDLMSQVAMRYRKVGSYKSFLMGASQITDEELLELGIEIMMDEDSSARKLVIPANSIDKYKELIRNKLDFGYWNDFVGEDLIYFIFKMPDGVINEYEYSEKKRLEIAALCTKLNNDPLEKTSDLLNYLAENDFYTEKVESYQRNLTYT